MITKLARLGSSVAALVLASTSFTLAATSATPATTTVAQASPAPTASPNPFQYYGRVRSYDFYRQNAYSGPNGLKPNQETFSNSISLHGQYTFVDSGFSVGATYLYATPFECTTAASHFPQENSNSCSGAPTNARSQNVLQDDTLPGFQMSTLYEAYGQYSSHGLFLKGGDMQGLATMPWAPASDTRLKPSAYTGVDGSYWLNKNWQLELADFWQWQCRTCSAFDKYTLLTDPIHFPYAGAVGMQAWSLNPNTTVGVPNNGVLFGRVGYAGPKDFPLTANLSYYAFDKIANMVWLDARMPFQGASHPFAALQFGSEGNATNYTVPGTSTSTGILGKIDSTVFGLQGGFNPLHDITFTIGFDDVPQKSTTISAAQAAGVITCSNTSHQVTAAKTGAVNLPYFLPASGTAQCTKNADGSIDLYYGGLASPYTDSYATDPLFTTGATQGMVDRRSAGTSYKMQVTYTSDDKQLVSFVSYAAYDYNNPGYAQGTYETAFDTTYYFSKIHPGAYHGFSFRWRYADRDESTFTGSPAPGLFKYNRFQAQYDF